MAYTEPIGDIWKYDPDYNAAADFLGIDKYKRENVNVATKLSFIIDWVSSKNKTSKLENALLSINDLKRKLGINTQGETLVSQLYEFARVKSDLERKSPDLPYKEVMNQMIEERRSKQVKHEELSFKSTNQQMKRKAQEEDTETKKSIQHTIKKYQSSFKPEPELKVRVADPVDHTPQPV